MHLTFCIWKLSAWHFVTVKWTELQGMDGPSWPFEAGFQPDHRLLILPINSLNRGAATNQQNHMLHSLLWSAEVVSNETKRCSALHVTCLPAHTLGNGPFDAPVQSCEFVCGS